MSAAPLRVLVVDDDEEDFLILRDLLSDYPAGQYELSWVPTLADGVVALRASKHDVYLVDYLLGPDNGLDLVRLAVAEGSSHRPVILLTGHGSLDVDREALAAGASDYLVKGNIDAEKLARSIRYAAERTRQLSEIEDTKQRYLQLFECNPAPTWVYDIETLRFIAVNDAMIRNYGYSRRELLDQLLISDIRPPEEAERLRGYLAQRGELEGAAGIWQHRRKDGSLLWVEVTSHPMTLDGRPSRIVIANDITARREAQAQMLLLERVVESSTSGVAIADAQKPDFPIVYVNAAFERITGYHRKEIVGRNCRFLQGAESDQPELDVIRHALRYDRDCNVVLRNFRKDGTLFWNHLYLSPVRDERGVVTHFVGLQNDLTERRRVDAELAHAASHDAVTDLPRYPVLEAQSARLLHDGDSTLTLYFIDIDHFHGINETMGHLFGDEALRVIAARLREALGDVGQVSRFAGDEFVAIAADLPDAQRLPLGHRLRAAVAEPVEGDGYRLTLSASIGISHSPLHGNAIVDLLRRAEAAMTRAKRQGRDVVCEFSPGQMQEIEDRLLLGARLREAARRGELTLHYQPLLCTRRQQIAGFEALLRWTDAELGTVSPNRFIPIAERLGLMAEIGQWVFNEVCRQQRAWQEADLSGFFISVNLSAQELQRAEVTAMLREAIERHAADPSRIEIEITESSLMEHVERVAGIMAEIKALGLRLSLDDFGTGYSSLSYLKQFSLDKLKIDRSFVAELPEDRDDAAIARTIVAIGHQLRMSVIAEGVETAEQAAFLREIGCDQLQGYFFGRPVPAEQVPGLIERLSGP